MFGGLDSAVIWAMNGIDDGRSRGSSIVKRSRFDAPVVHLGVLRVAVSGLLSSGGIVFFAPHLKNSQPTRLTQTVREVSPAPDLVPLSILVCMVGLT